MAEEKPQTVLFEGTPQMTAAVGVLLVLFCAFFWLGFFAGKGSATQAGAGGAAPAPAAPEGERIEWRVAAR